jgi:hypothetical protein
MKAIEEQRGYLLDLRSAVAEGRKRGLTLDEARSQITLEKFRDHLLYEFAHGTNIEAAWAVQEESRLQ